MSRRLRFHAECRLRRWKPVKKLTPEERHEAAEHNYPRELRDAPGGTRAIAVGFPTCGGFETDDRAAFEQHMADVHGRKSRPRGVWSSKPSELPYATGPAWRMPRPKALDPADWVDHYEVQLELLDEADVA